MYSSPLKEISPHPEQKHQGFSMRNRPELERLELNMLAMLCLRVVESGMSDSEESEEAGRLRREWMLLIGNRSPALPGLHTQQDIDAHAEALKQRMVTYLANFCHRESSQAQTKEAGKSSPARTTL